MRGAKVLKDSFGECGGDSEALGRFYRRTSSTIAITASSHAMTHPARLKDRNNCVVWASTAEPSLFFRDTSSVPMSAASGSNA